MSYENGIPLLRIHHKDLNNIAYFLKMVLRPSNVCLILSKEEGYEFLNLPLYYIKYTMEIEFIDDELMVANDPDNKYNSEKLYLKLKNN